MTSRSGETWFTPGYRMADGRPKKIVPVSRAGWMTFLGFAVGEAAAILGGAAIIVAMPDQMILGFAVIGLGLILSIGFLVLMIYRHTDFTLTRDEFRARQARA